MFFLENRYTRHHPSAFRQLECNEMVFLGRLLLAKERAGKGSADPFIEIQRKGSVKPQYENGIRGNTIFDSLDPFGSYSNIHQS